jgi:hypothetical protein
MDELCNEKEISYFSESEYFVLFVYEKAVARSELARHTAVV